MELPKNVTQIGESDNRCKIYAEDYVISYMKQLNRHACDKTMAVALYGVRKEEAGISYLFFYGAGRINFLQRESRHLSQAQLQEIEKLRRKYFSEYVFLGYSLLNGEMVEGFHIYEQGVCRYITGYAQFYEKNDSMLAFMLEERREEVKPEEVEQEKYEIVKKRQEERKAQVIPYHEAKKRMQETGLRRMKYAVAAVFALLCVAGLSNLNNSGKIDELQVTARQMIEQMTEQQLPDAVPAGADNAIVSAIVAEDKLTEAIQKENEEALESGERGTTDLEISAGTTPEAATETTSEAAAETTSEATPEPIPAATPEPTPAATFEPTPAATFEPTPEPSPKATPEPTPAATPEPTPEPTAAPTSYTIKKGDTLIGICLVRYGSDARVSEVCELNGIHDPDDIKIGQNILLP